MPGFRICRYQNIGEVRVKVLAAGVSAFDLMFRRSRSLPGTPRVPFTLGERILVHGAAGGVGTALLDLGKLAEGSIKPVVAERIPLHEAARAHELLEQGGYAGKVVLVTGVK